MDLLEDWTPRDDTDAPPDEAGWAGRFSTRPRISLAFAIAGIGFLLALITRHYLTGGQGFLIGLIIGTILQFIGAFRERPSGRPEGRAERNCYR